MLEYEGDEEAEEENRHSHVTVVPLITPSSSSSSSFVRRIRESRLPLPSSSPHRETHASLLRRATHLTRPHSSLSLNRCPVKRVFQSDKERLRLLAEPRKDQTFNHCSFTSSSSPSAIPSPPLTQMHLAQQSSNEDVIYINISNDIDRLRLILTLPECLPLKRKLPYHFRPRTVSSSSPSSSSIEYLTRYRINPAGSNSLLHLYEYSSVNFICFVFNFHMEVLAILDLSTGTSRSIDGIVLSPDYIQRRRKVLASDRSRGNAFEIIFEDLPADIFAIVPVVQYATPFLTSMGASNLSSELFIRKNEPSDRILRGQRECDGLSPLTTASNFESSIRKTTMPITAWTGSFDENDFSERSVLVECVPESCIEASIRKEWSKLITSTTDLDSETGFTNFLEADHQQAFTPFILFRQSDPSQGIWGVRSMLKPVVTPCSTSSSGTELLEFVLQGMLFMKTLPFCAIHVEHCFDCASHSASSRHNAGTYERRFRKMRDACKGSLPPIFFNSNSTSLLAGKRPRFCSFEVTVLPYLSSSPKLIYSKLLLKDFPVNRRLVSLLSKELLPERIPLRHSRRLNIRAMDRRSRRPLVGVTVEVMKVNVLVRSEDDFGEHSNSVQEHKPVDSSDQTKVSNHYTSPRKTERPSPQVLNKTTFWGRAQVFSWLQSAGISDTVIRYMQANGVDTGERLLQLVNAKSLSKWGVRNRKHIEAVIKGIAALHEPDDSWRDLDYYRTLSEIDERIEVAFDRCKENQTHSHYQPLEVTKGLSNAAGLFRANISEVGSYAVRVSGDLLMSFESGVFRISAESEAATNIIIDLRSKQGFLNVSAVCSQRSIYKFCGHRGILLGFRRLDDGHRTLHFLPFRESYHTDAAQLILSAEISLDVGLYYSEIDGGVLDINNEAAFELFYESEVLLARNHRRSVSRVFRRLQLAIRRRQRRVYTLKEVSALCRIARLVMRSSLLPRARQRAAILKMARNFAEIKLVSFQAIIRGVLLRAKTLSADVGRFGDAVMYIQNRIRTNTNACNQIQRVIRGYQSRRRTRLLKRRETASSFISNTLYRRSRRYIFEATQRNYTGFETYLMRKEEALSKLRHQFELELIKVAERRASAIAKKLLVQMNRAKASIEKQRLLLEEQSKLAAITLSAIRIQVCMRASLVKKWYVRQKKAILRIQSFLRRRFNRIKEEKVRIEVILTAGLINTVVEPSATHMKIESTRHIDARDMSLLLLNKVLPSKGLQQCQLGTNGNLSDTNPNEEKVRKVFNEEDIEPIPPLAGGVEDSSDHCRPVTGIDALMSNDNKSIHSTSLSLPASIIRDFYLRRRVKRAPLSKSSSNVENCFDVEPNVVLGCYEYISQAPLQPTFDALHVTTEPDCVSAEEASRTKTNRRILATSRSRRRFNDTDSSDDDST